jgi:hypothetical protein
LIENTDLRYEWKAKQRMVIPEEPHLEFLYDILNPTDGIFHEISRLGGFVITGKTSWKKVCMVFSHSQF